MANHVTTSLQVTSKNKDVFKQLSKWFEDKPYSELSDTMFLYHILYGNDAEDSDYDRGLYTERMGAKWAYIEDTECYDDYFRMNTTSAWYFIEGAIERLGELLYGIDNEVLIKFTFEDEGLDPIGGGAWYRNEIDFEEESYEQPDEDVLSPTEYDAARDVMYEEVYEISEGIMDNSAEFLLREYKPNNDIKKT